jgi:hypothetical protein
MEMSTVDLSQLAFVFRSIPTLWIQEIVQLLLMLKTHINGKANCESTDCWALPVIFFLSFKKILPYIYIPFDFTFLKIAAYYLNFNLQLIWRVQGGTKHRQLASYYVRSQKASEPLKTYL